MMSGFQNDEREDYETMETKTCPNSSCNFNFNVKNANFCILCGTLLYQRCDDCLNVNPKYAKFCHFCGTSIDDLNRFSPGFNQEEAEESN